MKRTKDELLLECIKQFEHIENVLEYNRLASTKSLINEIEQALRIHDVVGRSEQLKCHHQYVNAGTLQGDTMKKCLKCGDYVKAL